MADLWFSQSGAEGNITIQYSQNGWEVIEPDSEMTTRCIFQDSVDLSPGEGPYRISGVVSKYIIGSGDRPNYLHFQKNDGAKNIVRQDSATNNTEKSTSTSVNSLDIRGQANYPYRELAEVDGSGDNISVVARVEHIYWMKKNESGMPDFKGRLTDDSISYGVAFVVGENVSHPYVDENKWFLFDNVTDYYYEPNDQVTIWISDETEFEELEPVSFSTSGKSSTSNSSVTASSTSTGSNKSLDEIAADTIGDTTFTIKSESQDSAVKKAKKKAKNQQRDPAIDPEFQ